MTSQRPLPDPEDLVFASGQDQKEFTGRLLSVKWATPPAGRQQFSPGMEFQFTEVTMIDSISPWPFPQFSIIVPYSLKGARWIALVESIEKIIGVKAVIGQQKGKILHMKWSGGHEGRIPDPNDSGSFVAGEIECWTVYAIDGKTADGGVATVPVSQQAEAVAPVAEPVLSTEGLLGKLAHKKGAAEFQQAAMQNNQVKNGPLFQELVDKGMGVLAPLLASGALSVVDGVYMWRDAPVEVEE